MALEETTIVDAIGVERNTGFVVLTLTDAWDWEDEEKHLSALKDKINTYLFYIETGELLDTCPEAAFRTLAIDV